MAELPATADVAVIGGGVVGASTLYHLTTRGCTNAVLIERETIGAGSTSKAAGGIRAQFSDELNIRIALENIKRFEVFEQTFGVDIDYRQWGYLFLISEAHLATFQASVALQRSLGVPVELLTVAQAQELIPQLGIDGIAAATFCPIDGFATPETVAQAYIRAARDNGASVVQGCEVTSIDVDGGVVSGVTTAQGKVSAPIVVYAGGVWATELTAAVGLDLPVSPLRRHIWLTEAEDPMPHELPLVVDFASSFYFLREGRRLMLGSRYPTIDEIASEAMRRLPILEQLPVKHGWSGLYAMSPDHNGIVGRAVEPSGLLYATGFSGHGFMQSPVTGDYLAALATGTEPPLDLSPLAVERFATADIKPEANVI